MTDTESTAAPRTVIVTGGSRGLGQAIVQSFLDQGDRVATCSRSPAPSTEAWGTESDRFYYEAVDLYDRESRTAFVQNVVGRFGTVEVLVNNAGVARDGVLALVPDDDVDEVIDLNLKATIHLTRLVARLMLPAGAGRIINISSVVGLSGYRGLSVYSSTKAALDGFTRSLARELGPRGITVNSVAPGYMRTEMSHGLTEEQLGQIARRTPAGRLGEPSDVAVAVRFLASAEAGFVNGQVLVVDGGLTA